MKSTKERRNSEKNIDVDAIKNETKRSVIDSIKGIDDGFYDKLKEKSEPLFDKIFNFSEELENLPSVYIRSESQMKLVNDWADSLMQSMNQEIAHQLNIKSGTGSGKTMIILLLINEIFNRARKKNIKTNFIALTMNDGLVESLKDTLDEFGKSMGISDNFKIMDLVDLLDGDGLMDYVLYVSTVGKIKSSDNENRVVLRDDFLKNEILKYRMSRDKSTINIVIDEFQEACTDLMKKTISIFGSEVTLSCLSATQVKYDFFSNLTSGRLIKPEIELPFSKSVDELFVKRHLKTESPLYQSYREKYKDNLKNVNFIQGMLVLNHTIAEVYYNNITGFNPCLLSRAPFSKKDELIKIAKSEFGLKDEEIAYYYHHGGKIYNKNYDRVAIQKSDSKIKLLIFDRALGTGFNLPRAISLSVDGFADNEENRVFNMQLSGRVFRTPSPFLMSKYKKLANFSVFQTAYLFTNYKLEKLMEVAQLNFYTDYKNADGENQEYDAVIEYDLDNIEPSSAILKESTSYNRPRLYNDIPDWKNFGEFVMDMIELDYKLKPAKADNLIERNINLNKMLKFNIDFKNCVIEENVIVGDFMNLREMEIEEGREEDILVGDYRLTRMIMDMLSDILEDVGHYTNVSRVSGAILSSFNKVMAKYFLNYDINYVDILYKNLKESQEFKIFITTVLKNYIPTNIVKLKKRGEEKGVLYEDVNKALVSNRINVVLPESKSYSTCKFIDKKKSHHHKLVSNKLLFPLKKDGKSISNTGYVTEIEFIDDMHTISFGNVEYILKNDFDKNELIKIMFVNNDKLSTYSFDYRLTTKDGTVYYIDVKSDMDRAYSKAGLKKLRVMVEHCEWETSHRNDGLRRVGGYIYYSSGAVMFKYGIGDNDVVPFSDII